MEKQKSKEPLKSRQDRFNERLRSVLNEKELIEFLIDIERDDVQEGGKFKDVAKISTRQLQKIIRLSKNGSMGLSMALEYGEKCVQITTRQKNKLLSYPQGYIRELVATMFSLDDSQIQIIMNNCRDNRDVALQLKVLKKYAQTMSNELVHQIQLRGSVLECSAIWSNGRGQPPVAIEEWMKDKNTKDLVSQEAFNAWHAAYFAKDEADRIKAEVLGLISDISGGRKPGRAL